MFHEWVNAWMHWCNLHIKRVQSLLVVTTHPVYLTNTTRAHFLFKFTVCVCRYVSMPMCVHESRPLWVHANFRSQPLLSFLRIFTPCLFAWFCLFSFFVDLELLIKLNWLAKELQGSSCLCLSKTVITDLCHYYDPTFCVGPGLQTQVHIFLQFLQYYLLRNFFSPLFKVFFIARTQWQKEPCSRERREIETRIMSHTWTTYSYCL